MSQYLKTVATVVLAVSALSVFFPRDSFGKYANLLSGIIVMAALLMPVINMEENIVIEEMPPIQELKVSSDRYLMDEFEKELSLKIQNKLKEDTGREITVTVYAENDGENVEIKKIELSPYTENIGAVVAQYIGIAEEKISEK